MLCGERCGVVEMLILICRARARPTTATALNCRVAFTLGATLRPEGRCVIGLTYGKFDPQRPLRGTQRGTQIGTWRLPGTTSIAKTFPDNLERLR